ncbi:DUF3667 domain-containing protein [Altererythrobacter sp. CAU 1778]
MTDITDAFGTATEGGLIARAIEQEGNPGAAAVTDTGHFAEGRCLNCGTELVGSHCHACGQEAHLHRTLGAFLHDLLHGVLHFEGKIWTTLPMLVRRPGELTRRYIDGERRKFVSPMALFLFGVFLMFAVFQLVGLTAPVDIEPSSTMVRENFERTVEQAESDRDTIAAELSAMPADDPGRAAKADDLAAANEAVDGLHKAQDLGLGNSGFTAATGEAQSFIGKLAKKWDENPSLMLYKLQANSYKFSWLLIPLSIPFVWVLFAWRRRFKAYDHAIFVTYSLSFMTLLFITASLLTAVPGLWWVALTLMVLVPPVHIYKQLRGAYSLSRPSAFWRLCALSIFIWIVVTLFLQILLMLGAV